MKTNRNRLRFQLALLFLMTLELTGCSAVRSMIGDSGHPNSRDEPYICDQCGVCASCAAPLGCGTTSMCASCAAPPGCGTTPYMTESTMMNQNAPMTAPALDMQIPSTGSQSEAEQWAPRSTWLSPSQPLNQAPAPSTADCDVQLKAAKVEFDAKLAALESRFEAEQMAKNTLNSSLDSMNSEVSRLAREVEFWRDEVRRIDRTTEAQHRSDMASLKSISQMIDTIAAPSAGH